jgi:cell division protein ZapA (FtsZ GTPase activity inhibitor)
MGPIRQEKERRLAMIRLSVLVCCAVLVSLLSCNGQETPSFTKAKAEYDALAKQMVQSVAYMGEPLKSLNDEQLAAVAALLVMTRLAAQSEGIEALASADLSEGFWVEVPEICPPMPSAIQRKLGGCLDEELAYAMSMAGCLADGKSEDECERDAAGEAAAAAMCRMRQVEEMRRIIGRIPGRQWPPGPFPWPVAAGP